MKIILDIPDIKLDEFTAREIFDKTGVIPEKFKDYWTNSYEEKDGWIKLSIEGVVDGYIEEEIFKMSYEDLISKLLKSVNHFEYEGGYGAKMILTTDDDPDYSYRKEGNLKDLLTEMITKSIKGEYSYGYCE